ncbi:MAG: hypothetical protein K6F23_09060 [Solobacterium sp.]|nr:hypothetical protein [Solobacterium sp.]
MKNVTLAISSCDKYSDLWDPFFTLLKKYWDPDMPIVLITESRDYSFEGLDIRTLKLYPAGSRPAWSELQMRSFERINTDYVIFLLDDFFLEGPVDEKQIENCIEWMDQDKQITCFNFSCISHGENLPSGYPGFELRPQKGEYRLNCQAAIWRRESLLKDMREHENAWVFETLGSKRSFRYKDQKFYCAAPDNQVFIYDIQGGGALNHGKWNQNAVELIGREQLPVDVSVRGINTEVRGSRQRMIHYIFHDLSPKRVINGISTRWKSLKP